MSIGPSIGLRVGGISIGPRIGSGHGSGTPQTSLSVAINDSVDPVFGGATNFNYTVVVTNTGLNQANNITAVVICDANTTFSSASGTGWVCNNVGHTVTCTRAALAPGAAPTITVTVTTEAAGSRMFRDLSSTADADADNTVPAAQASQATRVDFVTRDAASGIYCPASTAEWTTTMAAAGLGTGNPSLLWLCQEASGNLAETILGVATLTAANTPSYQQSVAGWTRLAVSCGDGTAKGFSSVDASLPDISVTSALLLTYASVDSVPAATRGISGLGAVTTSEARVLATNIASVHDGASNANGSTNVGTAQVRPWALKHNVTGSAAALYTNQDKVVPTFGATATGKKTALMSTLVTSAPTHIVYAVEFVAAAAEVTDAQVKTLLQTLGWTIPWS